MKLKCWTLGHWWKPDHTYEVPTLASYNPSDDSATITTYAMRECRRCEKKDFIPVGWRAA